MLFVVSSKAKTRIKAVLNEEKRKLAADGKEILARKLNNMHKVGVDENVDKLAKDFGYPNRLEFLCAIALEQFETTELKRYKADGKLLVLKEPNTTKGDNETQPGEVPPPGSSRANAGLAQTIIINDEPGAYYNYTFAKCCSPSQGDAIFAYLNNEGGGANIHKATCSNAKYLLSNYSYRILKAEWGNTVRSKFVTELIVTGRDIGKGVIAQVSACIENLGINVIAFNMRGDDAGHFQGLIEMEVNTAEHLNLLISTLKGFDYVTGVQRREPG